VPNAYPTLTGRQREVLLGKNGKASITHNLEQMGIIGANDEERERAPPSEGC